MNKPEYIRARAMKRRRLLNRFQVFKGCADCGYREDHRALEFHHVEPGLPITTGGVLTGSRARLKCEMSKCIVLCANCHAIRTLGG